MTLIMDSKARELFIVDLGKIETRVILDLDLMMPRDVGAHNSILMYPRSLNRPDKTVLIHKTRSLGPSTLGLEDLCLQGLQIEKQFLDEYHQPLDVDDILDLNIKANKGVNTMAGLPTIDHGNTAPGAAGSMDHGTKDTKAALANSPTKKPIPTPATSK